MQARRAGISPAFRHFDWIVREYGCLVEPALNEAHAFAVHQVDSRNNFHQVALVLKQNVGAGRKAGRWRLNISVAQ